MRSLALILVVFSVAVTIAMPASSPVVIDTPPSRIVYQRDTANGAAVPVRGRCPSEATKVEARLVPRTAGQETEWTSLGLTPGTGTIQGVVRGKGGWYNLEMRCFKGTAVVATATVERVGIGEVFAVVGHSVAAGQDLNIEGATDDRVNTVPLDSESEAYKAYQKTGDTQKLPIFFGHYGSNVKPAPWGCGNYFWSRFGEHVAQKQNVPVLIFNAAFGGTSLEHWAKSSQNIPFEHSFVKAAIRMPYINLHNTLKKYVPATGIRAVLADQGQNDWPEKNEELVFQNYLTWVQQARRDLGYPELAIVVNRQTPFLRDKQIRRVQERMIQVANCFAGPDYDKLAPEDRPDAIHLGLSGQRKAAELWAEALDANFFATAKPWVPRFVD